jgi:hypothetical protein
MKGNGSKLAVPRHRVQCRDASNRQERAIEKQTRREGKQIVEVDLDEATYVGDEDDGVYFQVGKKGKNFYVSTTVDCNTGHFIDSLRTDDGPYRTEAEAIAHGRFVAEEWCFDNQVSIGE